MHFGDLIVENVHKGVILVCVDGGLEVKGDISDDSMVVHIMTNSGNYEKSLLSVPSLE